MRSNTERKTADGQVRLEEERLRRRFSMLNRNFKLIGLVAVLVLVLALPGVTQESPFSRAKIVSELENALAMFTVAEGDILDTGCARFYSDPFMTLAFIPLHPTSRSLQRLVEGEFDVAFEALYVPDDIPGFLPKGTYTVKLASPTEFVIVDQEGNKVYSGKAEVTRSDKRTVPYPPCFPWRFEALVEYIENPNGFPAGESAFVSPHKIIITETIEACYFWCMIKIKKTITKEEG